MKRLAVLLCALLALSSVASAQPDTPTETPTATPTRTPTNTPTITPAPGSDCCDCGFGRCTEPLSIEGNCPAGCVGVYGAACLPSGCATFTPTLGPQGTHTPAVTNTPTPTNTSVPPTATDTPTNTPTPAATSVCQYEAKSTRPDKVALRVFADPTPNTTPQPLVNDPSSANAYVILHRVHVHAAAATAVTIGPVKREYSGAASETIEFSPACMAAKGASPKVVRSNGATVNLAVEYAIE